MNKSIVFLFAIAALAMASSCSREHATFADHVSATADHIVAYYGTYSSQRGGSAVDSTCQADFVNGTNMDSLIFHYVRLSPDSGLYATLGFADFGLLNDSLTMRLAKITPWVRVRNADIRREDLKVRNLKGAIRRGNPNDRRDDVLEVSFNVGDFAFSFTGTFNNIK